MDRLFFITLLLYFRVIVAVTNGNFTTISDAIPQLAGLSLSPPRYPGLGTMNITNCCLFALNDAFAIEDEYLVIVDSSFLSPGTTAESFLNDMETGQFPCGSDFNGTEVKAPYKWCSIHCPGWQRAQPDNTKAWAFSLISFITPCLAFSTAIPRRRRLRVSDVLFKPTMRDFWMFILAPLRFFVAVIIVTIDVLMWLALCFAFAGPMILSGVFEVFLDSKILRFVGTESKKRLSKVMSTRLLYLILVGNLDFKWKIENDEAIGGDPWQDLEHLLEGPGQELKLPSMVELQNNYGSNVGIPIAFFCGGFVYNLFDIQNSLGTNDIAHALSFGMWQVEKSKALLSYTNRGRWIIVPHMAIISSLLLAGNNPFILQLATGAPRTEHRPVFGLFAQAYESRYKPEWLWFRGRSKYIWLKRVFLLDEIESAVKVLSGAASKGGSGKTPNITVNRKSKPQLTDLQSAVDLSIFDWVQMITITTALIFVPFILAFLTSFYTPTVGLSCRSLTFLTYFLAQMGQVALWVWVLSTSSICEKGKLNSPAYLSKLCLPNLISWLTYWTLTTLFFCTSIFAAIGGTIMQLLGVYSNCLCALPAKYWSIRYTDDVHAYVNLGSNSAADISAAQHWWMATGSVATGFLCAATYFGWWYQLRLRGIFRDVAEEI